MRSFTILLLLILFSLTVFPQKTTPTKKPVKPAATPTVNPKNEKEEFEKAAALTDLAERIKALQKFVKNFPKSAEKTRALELIVSARGQLGDDKLRAGETENGIAFFKAAVTDAPAPISDQLANLILQFPTNLFARGQSAAATEIAKLIEEKIGENPKQLLALSTYYLGIENGAEAKRIAENAIRIETNLTEKPEKSNLPGAYQTLGLASRLSFDFIASENAYAKALELDAASIAARRGLAETKRALGKADEAAALYREILAKDASDASAQTGLILSLFDAGKKQEAEAEMAKSLAANPNNLFLLVGAAYFYAAHGDGAKAVELAKKALEFEPRYTWTYIAIARGYMAQKQPLEAERYLLTARQYGDFPTLDYELATARFQAGFFREAADILKRSFAVKDDYVKAWIGNRVPLEATSFFELLATERQASIFAPVAADTQANSEKLKSLLELVQKLDTPATDDELAALGEKFAAGDDDMKPFRQLFVAKKLLDQKKALPKVLELTQSATAKVDAAVTAPSAAGAILADALYESRTLANSRGQVVLVPNIAQPTLSKILRGEIEEIAGWALFQQNKPAEAVIRLKRALSVLPKDSAWWRSSQWRLGSALEADGKSTEALEAYIKSYLGGDAPDAGKYLIIEALYQKIHGSTEGLAEKIGNKPALIASQTTVAQKTEPTVTPAIETTPTPTPSETKTETTPTPQEVKPVETPAPTPTTEIKTEPTPQEIKPTETPAPTPQEIKTEETPVTTPTPATETTPTPTPVTETTPTPTPALETSPTPATETTPTPATETTPTPTVETENKTETVAKNQADVKTETETKPAETSKNPNAQKPLFEPVIITIPKPAVAKTETKPIDKAEAEKIDSGEVRVRKVAENKTEETPPCTLVVNQESISVFSGGGSLGVLVGYETEGDLKLIKAISSSPADVEVIVEPKINEESGRVLFVVTSITPNKGAFTVTFEAPCGKKEILVKVR